MIKMIISELSSLTKQNKMITFFILSIGAIFSIIASIIFAIKDFQTVYTYYLALNMLEASVILLLEGITIGILLNLISKKILEKNK